MSEEHNSDNTPAEESKEESQEQPIQPPDTSEPETVKRARGRPVGVKDKVQRTRKKITIIEEAIAPKPPPQNEETPAPTPELPPPNANPVAIPENANPPQPAVLSPRSLHRVHQGAAELLTSLRRAKFDDRRENLRNMYSKGMTRING